MAKIGFVSLGCAKNQVNTEQMIYLLQQAGYEILPDPDGAVSRISSSTKLAFRFRLNKSPALQLMDGASSIRANSFVTLRGRIRRQ